MEIKILVKENEKEELDKFIKTCEEHGMKITRSGGGNLPSFSGYYASFEGVRWQKDNASNERVVCFKCGKKTEYDRLGNWCFECKVYTHF